MLPPPEAPLNSYHKKYDLVLVCMMTQELFKILGGQKSIVLTDPTYVEGSSITYTHAT